MPAVLAPATERLLEGLPPFLQEAAEIRTALDVIAREAGRVEAARDELRDNFFPQSGEAYLHLWEVLLRIAVNPSDKSVGQRRNSILAFLRGISSAGSGLDWEAALGAVIGTGWSYEEHVPPSLRPTNLVERPSFELGNTTGYSFSASDGANPAATLTVTTDWARAGTRSARYQVTRTDGSGTVVRTLTGTSGIPVKGGATYAARVSARLRAAITGGGVVRPIIYWFNSSGTQVQANGPTTPQPAVGEIFDGSVVVAAHPDAAFASVGMIFDSDVGYSVDADVDAYMLTEVEGGTTVAPAYFDGDTAGYEWSGTPHASTSRTDSPPAYAVRITVPFTPGIESPTGLAATAGAGGTLAAGTYYYGVTGTNEYGETTLSDVVSVVVAADGSTALNWNDVAGASGYRVYRGLAADELRQIASVTASEYTDLGAATTDIVPPAFNSTESFQASEAAKLARRFTPAHVEIQFAYGEGFVVGFSGIGQQPI